MAPLLAVRIARRELRAGLAGFRLFVACLALGVAAIAAVGSFAAAVVTGLDADARRLLGGDVEVRQIQRPLDPEAQAELRRLGRLSEIAEMRAMVHAGPRRLLAELKAVDGAHPLVGAIETEPVDAAQALAGTGGPPPVLLDAGLARRLGAAVGDTVHIGEAEFVVRGTLVREPDRGTAAITLGPPALVRLADLPATGLVQPGSLAAWRYRLALPDPRDARAVADAIVARHPDAGWRVRTVDNAAPGLVSFIDRLRLYLTLVGLTALLVGGVGVANAVAAFVERKQATVAILKCLGASGGTVLAIHFLQVAAMALAGIAIGLAVGAALPWGLAAAVGDRLPVEARVGLYPGPLATAAAFGLLTALAFALWPLGRARAIPPARLFRDMVQPDRTRPGAAIVAGTVAAALALAGLAVATAPDRRLALWYVAGAAAALALFRLAGWAVMRVAAAMPRPGRPALRLAVANLHRPGSPAPSVVLSLGLGLTTLIAIVLIQANLQRQVTEAIPEAAPTFFFIDLQPGQVAAFDRLVASHPGVERHARVPSLRGRITRLGDTPVDQARVAPEAEWALRNERGLTYAAQPPEGTEIVAGAWWPADYRGAPLISLDADVARGLGLGVGDTMTLNVLGREVTARIANLRRIRWTSLAINFAIVFAPGTLEGAPQTHIATARVTPEEEVPLLTAVTDRFVNVSAIRVRDALEAVGGVLGDIAAATDATAAVTLAAGLLVLAGAAAAGHQRRVRDAVVLKVLGATRRHVLAAYLLEYGLLGAATAAVAALFGTLAGWLVLTQVMRVPWTFLATPVLATAGVAVLVTLVMGFAGTWRALARKAAPVLRNP